MIFSEKIMILSSSFCRHSLNALIAAGDAESCLYVCWDLINSAKTKSDVSVIVFDLPTMCGKSLIKHWTMPSGAGNNPSTTMRMRVSALSAIS